MTNLIRSKFQDHPFHLVSPSPWPIYTSLCIFSLTTSAALSMHNFYNAYYFLYIALILVVISMSFWFRDVISEGKIEDFLNKKLYIARSIQDEELNKIREDNLNKPLVNNEQLGFYLAGLLEGDGCINLPFLGKTVLNRILNPRIIFTSHVNNLALYVNIQSALGGIGRFQLSSNNVIIYIIGDIRGLNTFINIVHNKLRTPKNETFNQLIDFLNLKYNWDISKSKIDKSSFSSNSWLTGFIEADGHFGVKIIDFKLKCEGIRLRSKSQSISLKFVLAQRYYDKKTSLSMLDIMEKITEFLSCNLSIYKLKDSEDKVLSISISSINKLKFIVDYINNYPLFGIKSKDFKDWLEVYKMIINKEHLTEVGRSKIKLLRSNMNSKRIEENKDILESKMLSFPLSIFLISIIVISLIINIDILTSVYNSDFILYMADDNSNVIKGTMEVKNIKVENLDSAIEKMKDASLYLGGMAITGKIIRGSSLPIGAKLGATLGMGAASLVGYHMVQKNLGYRTRPINIKAEGINTTVDASKDNEFINKLVQSNNNNDGDSNHIISLLDIEQLQLDYYLHLIMIYLFIILFVIIIMKAISKRNFKFKYALKLPKGVYIQELLIKIFKWWDKTNDFWLYSILICLFISLIVSAWSIGIIIDNIH